MNFLDPYDTYLRNTLDDLNFAFVNDTDDCVYYEGSFELDEDGLPIYIYELQLFCLVFGTICFSLIVLFFIFLAYHSKNYYDLFLIGLIGIGALLQITNGPLREFIGRHRYSCDLHLFCVYCSITWLAGLVTLRLWLLKYKYRLYDQIRFLHYGQSVSEFAAVETFKEQFETATEQRGDGSDMKSQTESQKSSNIGGLENIKPEEYTPRLAKLMKKYENVKSRSYIIGVLVFLFAIIAALSRALSENSKYLKGCTGCQVNMIDNMLLLIFNSCCLILVFYTYKIDKQRPDPLLLYNAELPFLAFAVACSGLGLVLISFDFDDISQTFGYLAATLGISVGYYGLTVIKALRVRRKRKRDVSYENRLFLKFLDDKTARYYFAMFCVKEMSIENLTFYTTVQNWKSSHKQHVLVDFEAEYLYDSYVRAGAPLEINISGRLRENLMEAHSSLKNNGEAYSKDFFDEALHEVKMLMGTDTWTRFVKSDLYKEYNKLHS